MSCAQLTNALPRISARRGQVVDLNVEFMHNGVLTDPYAIRYVEIYKTQVLPHNLISLIPIVDPDNELYPAPLCRDYVDSSGEVDTSSDTSAIVVDGSFHLPYSVPDDAAVPDIYFDVWYYFASDPCGGSGTCDLSDSAYESSLLKCCHRFWVYPENWFCDDKLQTIRFGFEPLDQRFHQPEVRPLEVGLMPLRLPPATRPQGKSRLSRCQVIALTSLLRHCETEQPQLPPRRKQRRTPSSPTRDTRTVRRRRGHCPVRSCTHHEGC